MANIFGIIAAVVLAVTAFFALKNKAALEEQIDLKDGQESKLSTNNSHFKELKEEAVETEEKAEVAKSEGAQFETQLKEVRQVNQTLESDKIDKESARDSKNEKVDELKSKLAAFGDLNDLKRKLEQLQIDLGTLNGELVQKDAEITSRSAQLESFSGRNEGLQSVLSNYTKKQSNPGMSTSVTRVVHGLGFVILGGGDNLGIVKESTLNVVRGGDVVGKLLVTATEPSSASASVVPDSFGEGDKVRVGDKVVASSGN